MTQDQRTRIDPVQYTIRSTKNNIYTTLNYKKVTIMEEKIPILISHLEFYEEQIEKNLSCIKNIKEQIEKAQREVDKEGNIWYCNRCCQVLSVNDKMCPVCKKNWDLIEIDLNGHVKMLLSAVTGNRNLFNNIMDELDNYSN